MSMSKLFCLSRDSFKKIAPATGMCKWIAHSTLPSQQMPTISTNPSYSSGLWINWSNFSTRCRDWGKNMGCSHPIEKLTWVFRSPLSLYPCMVWILQAMYSSLNRVFLSFARRCTCYTCNYAYSAIPCDKENSSKNLKNWMETIHIIMTMEMWLVKPPWISICLVQNYKTKSSYLYG
jgi:hypothetical protein